MASYQYVYHMENVSKTYPGGKTCFENIHLNFLPGVKIGVVGVNGAGKSTLLKIMAGMDKDFKGEAWAAKGAKVGYLAQEPHLDPALTAKENVMLGVAEQTEDPGTLQRTRHELLGRDRRRDGRPARPDRRRQPVGA